MNPPLKRVRGKAKPKPDRRADRERLLAEFDMISEEDLAILFGVEYRTLKTKPLSDLPPFTKIGGTRMYFKSDVTEFMRKRMSV